MATPQATDADPQPTTMNHVGACDPKTPPKPASNPPITPPSESPISRLLAFSAALAQRGIHDPIPLREWSAT